MVRGNIVNSSGCHVRECWMTEVDSGSLAPGLRQRQRDHPWTTMLNNTFTNCSRRKWARYNNNANSTARSRRRWNTSRQWRQLELAITQLQPINRGLIPLFQERRLRSSREQTLASDLVPQNLGFRKQSHQAYRSDFVQTVGCCAGSGEEEDGGEAGL